MTDRLDFRVTDERAWERAFSAATPDELRAGIRQAWDERIAATSRQTSHPGLALAARLADVRSWLAPRMARTDATDEQRRSWEAQAAHWTHTARRDLGGEAWLSPLRLHVRGDSGAWLTLCGRSRAGHWHCSPEAPRVARVEPLERCAELLEGAGAMVDHERNLLALAGAVGETVREHLYPPPRLVGEDA